MKTPKEKNVEGKKIEKNKRRSCNVSKPLRCHYWAILILRVSSDDFNRIHHHKMTMKLHSTPRIEEIQHENCDDEFKQSHLLRPCKVKTGNGCLFWSLLHINYILITHIGTYRMSHFFIIICHYHSTYFSFFLNQIK